MKILSLTKIIAAATLISLSFGASSFAKKTSANNELNFDSDPFLEMNKDMIKEMELIQKHINSMHKQMEKNFEEARKNAVKGSQTDVLKTEDKENYYYELKFAGLKKEDIAVSIKNNILTFSGEELKTKNNKANSAASFYYSFSIPSYNNKQEPEILRQDNKITVKLKKLEK